MVDLKRLNEWEQEISTLLQGKSAAPLNIYCYENLSSTMDQVRTLLATPQARVPMLCLAAEQSSGRGRHGRTWLDSAGSFLGTYVFKSPVSTERLSGLPLIVGVTLRDLFISYGAETGLKWPNDVLSTDGRKLCGVLIELVTSGPDTFVLIGIGINLISSPQKLPTAVSLFDLCGRRLVAPQVAADFWPLLTEAWGSFIAKGFLTFKERYLAASMYLGQEISIQNSDNDSWHGRFDGVSDQGCLLLNGKDGVKEVAAGDLFCK